MRLIFLALIPCAAVMLALAEPITRLVYERGAFDAGATDDTADALFWFAFSLPFAGANLMLTRTFFALQQPWRADPTRRGQPDRQHRPRPAALQAVRDRRRRARRRRSPAW